MSYEVARPHFISKTLMDEKKSVPNVVPLHKVMVGTKWDIFCYSLFVYYTYILQLKNQTFYHGSAADLKERLKNHKNGIVLSTKNLRSLKLIFYAAFASKQKAMQFEKYLKTTSGWAFRNKRLI